MPISDAQQTQSQRRPPLLEFNDVNTYYGELHVLKGVNYRVGDGEIVCLLGGNASGKSTTMKTILGIAANELLSQSGVNVRQSGDGVVLVRTRRREDPGERERRVHVAGEAHVVGLDTGCVERSVTRL